MSSRPESIHPMGPKLQRLVFCTPQNFPSLSLVCDSLEPDIPVHGQTLLDTLSVDFLPVTRCFIPSTPLTPTSFKRHSAGDPDAATILKPQPCILYFLPPGTRSL
ncbi:hypothetical protein EX30DRAFT_156071 [Ascodesmis nigricans]|uniref:Uncharacterized protein n=1 Tax=Ascodesmis nigricans TaxID=341454 RepID=A0A4S2N2T1_9PEZI|nr:hypothetical protein EX30DRAFT_156071 [Ascodesmis nigricans]